MFEKFYHRPAHAEKPRTILERVVRADKLAIVVAYRDGLARFGRSRIEYLASINSRKILVLDKSINSQESELAADMNVHHSNLLLSNPRDTEHSNKIKKDSDSLVPGPTEAS